MPRPALPLFRPVLPRLVAWVGAQADFATVLAAWVGAQAGFDTVLAAWVGAQAGFAAVSGGRVRVSFSVSSSCRPEKTQFHTAMISVGHRSLSGRAIRLISISGATEFESLIDLFLFNIKLF